MSELRTDEDELRQLREEVGQLRTALESRVVIEQAKGVLSERYHMSVQDAFALLRYSARAAQTRLHELAARVVAEKDTPPPVMVGLARSQRWRAAAQRERAEAHVAHAAELRDRHNAGSRDERD